MEAILSGHDVIFVKTSDEASTLLEQEEYALVILGVHFDESQFMGPSSNEPRPALLST